MDVTTADVDVPVMPHSRPRQLCQPVRAVPDLQVHASALIDLDVWDFAPTTAPYWKWYWCAQPTAAVTARGEKAVSLGPDHAVLIPPGLVHAGRSQARMQQLFMHVSLDLPWRLPAIHVVPLSSSDRQRLRQLMRALRDGRLATATTVHFLSRTVLHATFAALPAAGWELAPRDPRLQAALQRLEERFPHALPNAALARAAGMSESSVLRLFRSTLGISPHAWLMRRRIDDACLRLHHDPDGIDAIAEAVGFCDRQHFTRVFTRLMGQPPARYRRQMSAWRGEGE